MSLNNIEKEIEISYCPIEELIDRYVRFGSD